MISAFARAALVLGDAHDLQVALGAARYGDATCGGYFQTADDA